MVALFVFVMFVVVIAFDYFFRWRPAQARKTQGETVALNFITRHLPSGAFYSPNFSWVSLATNGKVRIGVNPLLIGLTGKPDKIRLIQPENSEIQKGIPLLALEKDGREIKLSSPVSGKIMRVNPVSGNEIELKSMLNDWLYELEPSQVGSELKQLFVGEEAMDWIQGTTRRLKEFFSGLLNNTQPSASLADGGELPYGILTRFESDAWEKFQSEFLN